MANEFAIRDAGKVMIRPRGAFMYDATYEMLDMVSYEGNSYIALANNLTNILPTDGEYWEVALQANVDNQLDRDSLNGISNQEVTKAIEGIRDALEMIGIKNLLNVGKPSGTKAGFTYETTSGVIVINGTSTESSYISIVSDGSIILNRGRYHFSGCPDGGGINQYYLRFYSVSDDPNAESMEFLDFGNGFYFDVEDPVARFNLEFVFNSGLEAYIFQLKPMITYSYDDESDYNHFRPYQKGATIAVDSEISPVSQNPVENKAIYAYIENSIIGAINGSY